MSRTAKSSFPKSTLSVKGLVKDYGKKHAVAGVSFSMDMGEVVGLLGPNGAGKTTIFYMIVGFIKPTAGEIYLDEKEISREPMYVRAREGLSYLPQEASIFRKLTVEENLLAVLELRKNLPVEQRMATLEYLLDELGLQKIRKQKAYTLSGGERRRTEIARALAIEPKFLLLDEPFAGIDPKAVSDIQGIIRDLSKKGIGVLITDHSVHYTLEITKRSYIINLGEIIFNGTKKELLANQEVRSIYLGEDFVMH
ncbi:MAG: LPS export ABC transporter ATP-binding protein [Spirochaetaceae bacterium]|nr:MAG: LPS export ABC transporter ATP-binding protein [Spirochaetaceae bacterium]